MHSLCQLDKYFEDGGHINRSKQSVGGSSGGHSIFKPDSRTENNHYYKKEMMTKGIESISGLTENIKLQGNLV